MGPSRGTQTHCGNTQTKTSHRRCSWGDWSSYSPIEHRMWSALGMAQWTPQRKAESARGPHPRRSKRRLPSPRPRKHRRHRRAPRPCPRRTKRRLARAAPRPSMRPRSSKWRRFPASKRSDRMRTRQRGTAPRVKKNEESWDGDRSLARLRRLLAGAQRRGRRNRTTRAGNIAPCTDRPQQTERHEPRRAPTLQTAP